MFIDTTLITWIVQVERWIKTLNIMTHQVKNQATRDHETSEKMNQRVKSFFGKIKTRKDEIEAFWDILNYVKLEREALIEYGITRGFCTPEGFSINQNE